MSEFVINRDGDCLAHHGIKGQQWGVRNGPPYPIEPGHAVTIKKGTTFKRLSSFDESAAVGHAYVTYLKEDTDRYQGFFGLQKKAKSPGADVWQVTMTAAKDMTSPSQKERIDIFLKMYQNDPVGMGKELGQYHKKEEYQAGFRLGPSIIWEHKYGKLKDSEIVERGYRTFVKAIGGNEKLRSQYFNELRDRGYDFIRDDQDATKRGIAPTIVLDREKSLKYEGQRVLTTKEMLSSYARRGGFIDREKQHKEWESK